MPYLLVGGGARPVGLGDAFTSLADDVSAIYWNPAGLAQIKKTEVFLSRFNSYQNISYNFIEIASRIKDKSTLGAGITYIDFGSDEKRDDKGRLVGRVQNSALGLNLCYGEKILDNLMAGVGIKTTVQNLSGKNYSAVAFDGGMLYKFSNNLAFGYTIQNLGANIEGFQLPLNLRVGMLTTIDFIYPISICTDIIFPRAGYPRFASGIEATIERNYFMRIGFNNKQDTGQSLTFGFGVKFKGLKLDAAYLPSTLLGNTMMFSIGIIDFANFIGGKEIGPAKETRPAKEIKPAVESKKSNRIRIKVIDESNIDVVRYATVKIVKNDQEIGSGFTDDNGEYLSEKLSPGKYLIKAWKRGYIAAQELVEVTLEKPTRIVLHLKRR